MTEEIMSAITNEVYGVWFLIGAERGCHTKIEKFKCGSSFIL